MTPDNLIDAAVRHHGSRAMVLAPPGCGKTHLLAERVAYAHGTLRVPYADMLCLTFTNRAARGMRERVRQRLGELPEGLFAGSIHRFCISFLHASGLISPDTCIIDDCETEALTGRAGAGGAAWRNEVLAVAVDEYMRLHDYPQALHRRLWFEPSDMHRRCAAEYAACKRERCLMDFDDVLLWTYDALRAGAGRRYSWVQVDEVQDLTPLQVAITGMLAPAQDATVLYLGDGQQAIFDFLGAGGAVLDRLRESCGGRVMRLGRNYRSAAEIVELCDTFAVTALGTDAELLPDVGFAPGAGAETLTLWRADRRGLVEAVVSRARALIEENEEESTAILVRTNAELDRLHRALDAAGVEHLAVGASDAFRQTSFRTLYAHFAVALNPCRMRDWANILYQTGCTRRFSDAEILLSEMREVAMTPADMLGPEGSAVECALACINSGNVPARGELDMLLRLLYPARRGAVEGSFGDMKPEELAARLRPVLAERLVAQRRLAATAGFDVVARKLRSRYGAIYSHTQRMLASSEISADNTLAAELDHVCGEMVLSGIIDPMPRWRGMLALLATVVRDSRAEPTLRAQLSGHLHELRGFNEGDLCAAGLAPRLTVMTVHKAKGLEMDNVIIADAGSFHDPYLDRARILYVAMSRARRRLAVFYSGTLNESLKEVADMFVHREAFGAYSKNE